MTRTEFLNAYCDFAREERRKTEQFVSSHPCFGLKPSLFTEAQRHSMDRNEAARLWRKQKNRLQNLTVNEWRKEQQKKERAK